ncbi:hypothetical protein, partial [Arcticibacter eurypsychrophilus]|uniref:hypothetical protein n=1 Tax=Arcticibacter eurypsychrophilus TaxID=1434752 RepID=UPI001B8C5F8C
KCIAILGRDIAILGRDRMLRHSYTASPFLVRSLLLGGPLKHLFYRSRKGGATCKRRTNAHVVYNLSYLWLEADYLNRLTVYISFP